MEKLVDTDNSAVKAGGGGLVEEGKGGERGTPLIVSTIQKNETEVQANFLNHSTWIYI